MSFFSSLITFTVATLSQGRVEFTFGDPRTKHKTGQRYGSHIGITVGLHCADSSVFAASKSVMAMPSVEEHSRLPQLHDDSIEEMASMLLEDTTINQLNANTEPDRRLSHAAAAKIFNSYSRADARQDLPQLPRLTFSGDDAWAMQTSPVIAASGNSNQIRFDLDDDPLSLPLQPTLKHNRKGSIAPTIPRKSSKRRSSRSRIPLHTSEKRNTVASRLVIKFFSHQMLNANIPAERRSKPVFHLLNRLMLLNQSHILVRMISTTRFKQC